MSRSIIRTGVSALALTFILAACGQAGTDVPAPSDSPLQPAQPSQPATPRPSPVATPQPSEPPTDSPRDPHTPTIVRHRLPMTGRITADDVAVRDLPDLDAPLVTGGSGSDEQVVFPNLRVDAGQEVIVTLGPVFADGLSWYYVHGPGNGDVHFLGWIAGEFITQETVSEDSLGALDGLGRGGSLEIQVPAESAIRVMFGVNVVDGDDACRFTGDVLLADGSVVTVADEHVTGPILRGSFQSDFAQVYQGVAGSLTLRVVTDCSFAASLSLMGH